MLATTASLADPITRGEDLEYNYRTATAIAPDRCKGCARYHINMSLGRRMGIPSPYGSDLDEFAAEAAGQIKERASLPGPIVILVAGAGDTGMPALLAHEVFKAGIIDRTEFVVVDRCGTPLQLCRDFGARHRLQLRTVEGDVCTLEEEGIADIIVVHSLLRFVREEARADCLRTCRRLLKPGGWMILSNTFAPQSGPERRSHFTEGLRALVERDAVDLAEPKERFLARLDQPPPWHVTSMTEADLHGLFRAADLDAVSIRTIRDAESPVENRGRLMAVFRVT